MSFIEICCKLWSCTVLLLLVGVVGLYCSLVCVKCIVASMIHIIVVVCAEVVLEMRRGGELRGRCSLPDHVLTFSWGRGACSELDVHQSKQTMWCKGGKRLV